MILRIFVIGTRSPGIEAGVAGFAAGAEGAGFDGAGADDAGAAAVGFWLLSRKSRMSCLVIRPPKPLPETCDKFTLCSRAILRTSGDDRACSSSSDARAAGATS